MPSGLTLHSNIISDPVWQIYVIQEKIGEAIGFRKAAQKAIENCILADYQKPNK